MECSTKINIKIIIRTIKYSIAWPLILVLFLLSISAPPSNYAFLFGALPSLVLFLLFDIDGFAFIMKCSVISIIVLFIPNLIYLVTGNDKRIANIIVSIYFLISSLIGGFLALGMLC